MLFNGFFIVGLLYIRLSCWRLLAWFVFNNKLYGRVLSMEEYMRDINRTQSIDGTEENPNKNRKSRADASSQTQAICSSSITLFYSYVKPDHHSFMSLSLVYQVVHQWTRDKDDLISKKIKIKSGNTSQSLLTSCPQRM